MIDEADRMVEQGHFQELSSILELIQRKRQWTSISIGASISFSLLFLKLMVFMTVNLKTEVNDSFYQILTLTFPFRSDYDEDEGTAKRRHLQKFIFSATLTLPKSFKRKGK